MRVDNWPAKFNEVVEEYGQKEFTWGQSDCFCFAADCIKAITGFDLLQNWREAYKTRDEALQLLEAHGGVQASAEEILEPLGSTECEINFIRRGDLLLLEINGENMLAIWDGFNALAPIDGRGLCKLNKSFIKKCWAIV
jgi:hypothetical protein